MATDLLETVRVFIRANALGNLAYLKKGDGTPSSAFVEFVVLPGDTLRLGFCTSWGQSGYRKYPHLLANPLVAVAFVNEGENVTFQGEGKATEVPAPGGEVAEAIRAKYPGSSGFLDDPEVKWFIVVLHWGKYANFADNIPENFDIREFRSE